MNAQTLNIIIISTILASIIFVIYSGGRFFNWLFTSKDYPDGYYSPWNSIQDLISSRKEQNKWAGGGKRKHKK